MKNTTSRINIGAFHHPTKIRRVETGEIHLYNYSEHFLSTDILCCPYQIMATMAAGRYFRALTPYDLLGNLLPGVFALGVLITLFPNPPIPKGTGGILFFAVLGFTLGHLIQSHASKATGDCFEATLDSIREYPLRSEIEKTTPNQTESDDSIDVGLRLRDEIAIRAKNMSVATLRELVLDKKNNLHNFLQNFRVWQFVIPMYLPISCFWKKPSGKILDNEEAGFAVFKDLITRYDIDRGTRDYHRLINIISSEIDDVSAPARSTRFQAIRNFHRAMWLASWYILIIVIFFVLLENSPRSRVLLHIIDLEFKSPALFSYWGPDWHLIPVFGLLTIVFNRLSTNFEIQFTEYLFSDYRVSREKTREGEGWRTRESDQN